MTESDVDIVETLKAGEITVKGEFLWGSNYTFLVDVELEGRLLKGVYKPTRGERPLWDFPAASLARREAAAYVVSEALGWALVPPTVYRRHAPIGPGSLQLYIDHDPEYHYFTFSEMDLQRLRPVALFDLVVNNADRKGSHVLVDPDDHIWLIDHGICFHVEDKIRTVIWDFAGEPFPGDLCSGLDTFRQKFESLNGERSELETRLKTYLSPAEIKAIAQRVDRLLDVGRFPAPNPYRRPYPWPQI
jgi:uncharacterized repeat protein (TIGR03843 family)